MSRNHSAAAYDIAHIVADIAQLERDEVTRLYGITENKDGSIFDPTYQMKFETIAEWATFSVEQDNVEHEEHFHSQYGEEH